MFGLKDDIDPTPTDGTEPMTIHRGFQGLTIAFALMAAVVPAQAQRSALTEKMNAYVGCINRESGRAYQSQERYFSWAAKSGPTGKERIIYGTYTIYDTKNCADSVAKANALEPHEPELEALGDAYVAAITKLEPLLKEADEYYDHQDYKDDGMAKGKALHPRLVAAWDAFATADKKLHEAIDVIQDKTAVAKLEELERTEGRKSRFYMEAVMLRAKAVLRIEKADPPDIAKITAALNDYEAIVTEADHFVAENKGDNPGGLPSGIREAMGGGIGSGFINASKEYLKTAKQLMRRVRDHVPYSEGDKMMLNSGGGAWMVEGSPARLTQDYNKLVNSYNNGGRF